MPPVGLNQSGTNPAGLSPDWWRGRSVFLTGHTGFKGGWLSLWLSALGARITGYALEPVDADGVYTATGIEQQMNSVIADVCDRKRLCRAMQDAGPSVVFHLAAQPLVRRAFREPAETFATNVQGTVNLLEAVRRTESVEAVVIVTSDKVYENHEWMWGYRETDGLGGQEPYGASKACAELVTEAYRHSYFHGSRTVGIATARAGNVIGGGDWSEDRLVPDAIRAFRRNLPLRLRNPSSTRPWQHVLEPLSGYLALAERLAMRPGSVQGAWNFGPDSTGHVSVGEVAEILVRLWGDDARWHADNPQGPYEAHLLAVDATKARQNLGWRPRWDVAQALDRTVSWYKAQVEAADMRAYSLAQIEEYAHAA